MRVAIQLYGHLRSFEQTHHSLFRYIIDPNRRKGIEFDIFIHTWDEFDAVQKPVHYEKNETYAGLKIPDAVKSAVIATYAPKACLIESQIALTEYQLSVIKTNHYNLTLCQSFRNTCHTFCAANQLRQEYGKANGIVYDLVIITRPDIIFYRTLDLVSFSKKRVPGTFSTTALWKPIFFLPISTGCIQSFVPINMLPDSTWC